MTEVDILILSNGPGEVSTWVRPVVKALRQQMGTDRSQLRISLVLSPCPNASGKEVAIAQSYPEIDRVQAAAHFLPFLLRGKTADQWDWRDRGVVLFLGGDQFFPVIIGKRLGYRIVIYGEWETRWHRWVDRFGVMKRELVDRVSPQYQEKMAVVGDLMADVEGETDVEPRQTEETQNGKEQLIGVLPGSKPAKLAQGVPLVLAIAQKVKAARPHVQFGLPVAPTLDLETLTKFANPDKNPVSQYFGGVEAQLKWLEGSPHLVTETGVQIELWTKFPAHSLLRQCDLCLTTIGANTAELGSLAVPMIVLLPTQQLDAMRAWDGIPGLLVNLPGVGSLLAKLINGWFIRKSRLLAWPNIWAGAAIVPERIGNLNPNQIADEVIDFLDYPEKLKQMRDRLRQVRGQAGAATRLAAIVKEEADRTLKTSNPNSTDSLTPDS